MNAAKDDEPIGDKFVTIVFKLLCILFGIFYGLPFLYNVLVPKQAAVYLQVTGRVEHGFFTGPSLELTCWHQHPGNLTKGTLSIWVRGKGMPQGEVHRLHSFEVWEPNDIHRLAFSFPLVDYNPSEPLEVSFLTQASNALDTSQKHIWVNHGWDE